jgi:hypothetical protein
MKKSMVRSLNKIFKVIIPIILISGIVLMTGCQQKEEKQVQQTPVITDTAKIVTAPKAADTTKLITDVKGKYSGVFDKRPTVLNINGQEGSKFNGNITINYREVINQKVSGEFDPKTGEFSMTDLLHSRYQGKYKGKFSEDFLKMGGTFTMALDGSKFSFNLTKK